MFLECCVMQNINWLESESHCSMCCGLYSSVKVTLDRKTMHVEGGDLPGLFTSKHFHFHWGNGSAMPGSEHAVDGKRYPMEV